MALRSFYEQDATKRHAGSRLTGTQRTAIRMMPLFSKDVILEVGCGGGALLSELEKKVVSIGGVDLARNQLIRETTWFTHFVIADSQNLPFKDQCFSKCFAIKVLEHIFGTRSVFNEFKRILKKDGKLLIVVPNDRNWFIHRILQLEIREAFYDFGHLHSFQTIDQLRPFVTVSK